MRSMVLEADRSGNLVTSAYSYATARDWARLGLLYQQEGVWQGKRLFSPEFMSFVRAPAPYWTGVKYGGQVWLNNENCTRFPCDSYQMNGIEGQRVVIIPSLDLVVVRLGFGDGDPPRADTTIRRPAIAALENALAGLTEAIPSVVDPASVAVEKTLSNFFEALQARDSAGLRAILTDDFIVLENGRRLNGGRLFDTIKASNRQYRWTITEPHVAIAGDLATIEYRNTGSFTGPDGRKVVEFAESATLRKVGTAWKLAFLHSTVIPQID
jgi:ketosteroid isomerase-like protein